MKKVLWVLSSCFVILAMPVLGECPSADLTGDCHVDMADLAVVAMQWLTGDGIPADMIYIPNGTFEMGDSFGEGLSGELPVHTVTLLSPFYMSKYEITNGQYCEFLNSELHSGMIYVTDSIVYGIGNHLPYCDTSPNLYSQIEFSMEDSGFFVRMKNGRSMANDPMVCVSWYGSVAFCNWRSQQEGYQSCYDLTTWACDFNQHGYRLSTEAEWEYAARGSLSGERFPCGDTISHSQANHFSHWVGGIPFYSYDVSLTEGYHPIWDDGMIPYSSPVGIFLTSGCGYGLYDMAGNVWEWCNDWYGDNYYSVSPSNNPLGPDSGYTRILRGGSWVDSGYECRVAIRGRSYFPDTLSYYAGFRVVLDLY